MRTISLCVPWKLGGRIARTLMPLCLLATSAAVLAADPPWYDGTAKLGFPTYVPDYYQHQKYGKTTAGGENDSSWEDGGGWCRPTSVMNSMYAWSQQGYPGLASGDLSMNTKWLPAHNSAIQAMEKHMFTDGKSVTDYLTSKGYGPDKGVGPGKGLEVTRLLPAGADVKYYSSTGALLKTSTGTNMFKAYQNELLDGKQVQIILAAQGGGPFDGSLWWKGSGVVANGDYHNVTGAGIDLVQNRIYFADPDSNKGNAKADAGINWSIRPDPAVNARKFIPWDGTNDVVPVAGRIGNGKPPDAEINKYFFGATIAADGRTIDGGVAANERYKNVSINQFEVIQPMQAAPAAAPGPFETFDISAGLFKSVDEFWLFPTALMDTSAATYFTAPGSSWTTSFLSPGGVDPDGNVRPYGGLEVKLTGGATLDPGIIGQLHFGTLSSFIGYDALFRDANDPSTYRVQVFGAPDLILPPQIPEPLTFSLLLVGALAAGSTRRRGC